LLLLGLVLVVVLRGRSSDGPAGALEQTKPGSAREQTEPTREATDHRVALAPGTGGVPEEPVHELPIAECELELSVVARLRGEALPDARVQVRTRPLDGGPSAVSSPVRRCDSAGRLMLSLPAGHQEVHAWRGVLHRTGSITIAPGERAQLRLELDATVPVHGRVVDAWTGVPIEDASVWIDGFGTSTEVHTDPDGRFEHPHLVASGVGQVLHVRAPGHGISSARLLARPDGSWEAQLPWTLTGEEQPPGPEGPSAAPPGDAERPSVPLLSMDRASGHSSGVAPPVELVDIALPRARPILGELTDERGAPVEAARVSARGHYLVRPGLAYADDAVTRSGADGRFELEGLRGDVTHLLECTAPGREALTVVVPPSPAATHDCGRLVLPADLALAGRVLDSEGRPVEDIPVRARRKELRISSSVDPVRWRSDPGHVPDLDLVARTEPSGRFTLRGLSPGSWQVSVRGEDREWVGRALELDAAGAAPLELRLPAEAGSLEGRVVRSAGPLDGLKVHVRLGASVRTVTCDVRGAFHAHGLAEDADLSVSCTTWHPGAEEWEAGYVAGARTGDADLELVLRTHHADAPDPARAR
jgi:hypothetical protein